MSKTLDYVNLDNIEEIDQVMDYSTMSKKIGLEHLDLGLLPLYQHLCGLYFIPYFFEFYTVLLFSLNVYLF